MPVYELNAEVIAQRPIGQDMFKLSLRAPEIARNAQPGQFVLVDCYAEGHDPFLRRPLSIYQPTSSHAGHPPDAIELVYRLVGRGTRLLSERRPGEKVPLLGPLGKGFSIAGPCRPSILVAGGIGVASLFFLAQRLASPGQAASPDRQPEVYALIGAHTPDDLVCVEDFLALGTSVQVTTWITRTELETRLFSVLNELTQRDTTQDCRLFACGPNGMLRRMHEFAQEQGIPCQVSLESHMACGLGACQSCVCRLRPGHDGTGEKGLWAELFSGHGYYYGLTCRDGPVFSSEELIWNA